ncbi:Poly-beta-1,6-N-acetyl-D-glucosamine synthase (plasmid) [Tautonia plasticadhaerens]|uniref:Poly-beta-1,6-N-acetyl-D-glucosamine synthase n=2 Tax=Tautonia plasticadhaerens TaxID=2527974 RepID=A0A518HFK3_9BACT|nr:Poly-beta-1,6-N-acetyl-D-glucosamine synthase [Tautonia plasticadhaerens]
MLMAFCSNRDRPDTTPLPLPRSTDRPMSRPRLCLITPCRDEASYARRTLDSVLNQTQPPDLWVIVDDGSTDETPEILDSYARVHPCIRVVRRADRGARKVGPGVIDAFYAGYEAIDPSEFDYVCKLDLDLDLPPRYFEILIDRMEADPRIGTCSGKPYFRQGDRLVSEKCGDENSVGMTKLYRRSCFEQVGGFVREVMWDGIDGHRCRMLGWVAASWDDPDLRFEHLRPMGTSHKGWWTGRSRHGFGQYFMGTAPSYMVASALFRMTRPPLVVGGLAMLSGYFGAMLRGLPRYDDPDFRRFLRSYQRHCLLRGKARTTEEYDHRSASRWSPDAPASSPVPGRSPS